MDKLDGEVYTYNSEVRNFILIRLNHFVNDSDTKSFTAIDKVTVRNIQPQTDFPDLERFGTWDSDQMDYWANRVANLFLLDKTPNSNATTLNLPEIRESLGEYTKSQYPLTAQILELGNWDSESLQKRQNYLMECFKSGWDLNASVTESVGPKPVVEKPIGERPPIIEVDLQDQPLSHPVQIQYLINEKRKVKALGFEAPNGFMVLRGSVISEEVTGHFTTSQATQKLMIRDTS